MQRIVVKNFGPLKDIDLEIKDFMVFVGPNASGKSTLAKLIYAFRKLPEINQGQMIQQSYFMNFEESFFLDFEKEFLNLYFKGNFLIKFFYSKTLFVTISPANKEHNLLYPNLYKFETNFKELISKFEGDNKSSKIYKTFFIPEFKIPKNTDVATNSYETVIKESKKILVHKPEFFSDLFDEISPILGGMPFINKNGEIGLILNGSGIFIEFDQLSSGQKENFWFLISVSYLRKTEKLLGLIIEEPEIHLFPQLQKSLIEYFVNFYNFQNLKLLITTHSHYILGVINVLINAHRIGQLHPEKVEKVISKEYWLDKGRVFVGRLKDGKLENVYSEEAEMFDHEELTQTSGLLNSEMDELYEIEFESENDKD